METNATIASNHVSWHVVSVISQFEAMAEKQLVKRVEGAKAFYPYALRDDMRKIPVLPGMLFASFPFIPDMHKIAEYSSWIYGFKRRPDGEHMTIPDWEIEDLRCRSENGEFNNQETCRDLMINRAIGQGVSVKVPWGPLVGQIAKAEALIGENVKLSITCLGKQTTFLLPASTIFPEFYIN